MNSICLSSVPVVPSLAYKGFFITEGGLCWESPGCGNETVRVEQGVWTHEKACGGAVGVCVCGCSSTTRAWVQRLLWSQLNETDPADVSWKREDSTGGWKAVRMPDNHGGAWDNHRDGPQAGAELCSPGGSFPPIISLKSQHGVWKESACGERRPGWAPRASLAACVVQSPPVQFSCSVVSDSLHPMDRSTPGLPFHHQLTELAQTQVHQVGDAIQPSHHLSSPSPPAFSRSQHQGLFQWVSSLHQVAKVLEFQLQHQFSQWIFRTDLL